MEVHDSTSYRSCISGRDYSIEPSAPDARNHRFRATDILISISLGGPEASTLRQANIAYEILVR